MTPTEVILGGAFIRAWREDQGLTIGALARYMGCLPQNLQWFEDGTLHTHKAGPLWARFCLIRRNQDGHAQIGRVRLKLKDPTR